MVEVIEKLMQIKKNVGSMGCGKSRIRVIGL